MAEANISAEFEGMRTAGRKIVQNSENYYNTVNKIYSIINGLRASWQGVDNQQYVMQLDGYKSNIMALGEAVENYGIFLQETANSYEALQEGNASAANSL